VQCRLEFYKPEDLALIITRAAAILKVEITPRMELWK
jgi:Holliday junction resolvasome RuvABC ATP-dependent DNA helicase subunit